MAEGAEDFICSTLAVIFPQPVAAFHKGHEGNEDHAPMGPVSEDLLDGGCALFLVPQSKNRRGVQHEGLRSFGHGILPPGVLFGGPL